MIFVLWLLPLLAAPVGPYSGVSVDNLLDRPQLIQDERLSLGGEALGERLTSYDRADDGWLAGADGVVELPVLLEAGAWTLLVTARAPDGGSDSLWVEVDGEQQPQPLSLPTDGFAERAQAFELAAGGPHVVRLVLREGPGLILRQVRISRETTQPPRPPMTAARAAARPRLHFTAAELPALRERRSSEVGQAYYKLPGASLGPPPTYDPNKRTGGAFSRLANYALAERLAPDPARLASIVEWLRALPSFATWGIGPGADLDLDAAYIMRGVAPCYDWLHDALPPDVRDSTRAEIAKHCEILYRASLADRAGGGRSFQQNHYWYAHLVLAYGAAAIYGEVPEAEVWLGWAWDRLERIFLTLGADGGFHEGPAYYDFSLPTLFQLIELYEDLSGLPIPHGDEGLAKSAEFRFHYLYPGLQRSAPMEDTTFNAKLPPTAGMLWLAERFDDPVAQGIAELAGRDPVGSWEHLLWLDPDLAPVDPRTVVPTGRYYPDVEMAFARTSWDPAATYFAFVCRPLGGASYAALDARYELGGMGHNHPAQNHFVLFGGGAELAADAGYTYKKETANHNTVLVDGQGQYGDGKRWPLPTPGRAFIRGFTQRGDLALVTGEAASAYPAALGVERFERTLALVGPDLVIVYDRLRASEPRTFDWLYHFYGQASAADGAYRVMVGETEFRLIPLLPAGVTGTIGERTPVYVHPRRDHTPDDATLDELRLTSAPAREATFLVVIQLGGGDGRPTPELVQGDGYDGVRVGERRLLLNRDGGRFRVGEQRTDAAAVVWHAGEMLEHRLER